MKEIAIININIEVEYPRENMTEEEKEIFLQDVDLPDNYVVDSFEFVKDMKETKKGWKDE